MTTTYYYVAGKDLFGVKKITACVNLQAAWNQAAKYNERPLESRADAIVYLADNDVTNLEKAGSTLDESEACAYAMQFIE